MARIRRPLGALVIVVAGTLGVTLGATSSAVAAPDYPTWGEVQAAREGEATTVSAISEIEGLAVALAAQAADLGRTAMQLGEEYNIAVDAVNAAVVASERLTSAADSAEARATRSGQAAGQVVAQLSRTAGVDLTLTLVLSDGESDDLLNRLGTMSRFSEQSATIYRQALVDRNAAQSLRAQALTAEDARRVLADKASRALDVAQRAADKAQSRVDATQASADQMYEQLATLKGTTADAERGYLEGLAWEAVQNSVKAPPKAPAPALAAPAPAPAPAPTKTTAPVVVAAPAAPAPAVSPKPTTSSAPTSSSTPPSAPAAAPVPDPEPAPAAAPTSIPAPNSSAVAAAIAFARAQIGDAYRLGGSGPNEWDCSGLTKSSYASAGVYIGTHSATNQYSTMASAGRLLPLSDMVAGDLLFYSTGGSTSGSKYHTTLYIGGGQMIEAPYPGRTVRAVPVRYGDLVPYAGRPTP